MKKIGIALFTLLATSACAESPTASTAGADAAVSMGIMGSGYDVEAEDPGYAGSDDAVAGTGETFITTMEMERGPGLAGSGH